MNETESKTKPNNDPLESERKSASWTNGVPGIALLVTTILRDATSNTLGSFFYSALGNDPEKIAALKFALTVTAPIVFFLVLIYYILKVWKAFRNKSKGRWIYIVIIVLIIIFFAAFTLYDGKDVSDQTVETEEVSAVETEEASTVETEGDEHVEEVSEEATPTPKPASKKHADTTEIKPGESVSGDYYSTNKHEYCFVTDSVSDVSLEWVSEVNASRSAITLSDDNRNVLASFTDGQDTHEFDMFTLNPGTYYLTIQRTNEFDTTDVVFDFTVRVRPNDLVKEIVGGKRQDPYIMDPVTEPVNGLISQSQMSSYYSFKLDTASYVDVCFASDIDEGPARPELTITDEGGDTVWQAGDVEDGEHPIKRLLEAGTYIIEVTGGDGAAGVNPKSLGNYEMSLSVRAD